MPENSSASAELDQDLLWLKNESEACEQNPSYSRAIKVCLATRNAFFSVYSRWLWGESAVSEDRERRFKEGLSTALRAVRLTQQSVRSNQSADGEDPEIWRIPFFAENIQFRIQAAQTMFDSNRSYEVRRALISKLLAVDIAKVA